MHCRDGGLTVEHSKVTPTLVPCWQVFDPYTKGGRSVVSLGHSARTDQHTKTSESSRLISVGSKNVFQSRARQGKHPGIQQYMSSAPFIRGWNTEDTRNVLRSAKLGRFVTIYAIFSDLNIAACRRPVRFDSLSIH